MTGLNLHKFSYKFYWGQIVPLGIEIRLKMNQRYLLVTNKLSTVYSNVTYLMLILSKMGSHGCFFGRGVWVRLLFKVDALRGGLGPLHYLHCKVPCKKLAGDVSITVKGFHKVWPNTHTWCQSTFEGISCWGFWKLAVQILFFFFLHDLNISPKITEQ